MCRIEREWVVALLNQTEKDFLTIRNVYRKRIKERGTPAKLPVEASLPPPLFGLFPSNPSCRMWRMTCSADLMLERRKPCRSRRKKDEKCTTNPALILLTVQVRILSPRQPHRLPIFLLLLADTRLFFLILSLLLCIPSKEAVPKRLDDNSPRPLHGDSTRLYSTS